MLVMYQYLHTYYTVDTGYKNTLLCPYNRHPLYSFTSNEYPQLSDRRYA